MESKYVKTKVKKIQNEPDKNLIDLNEITSIDLNEIKWKVEIHIMIEIWQQHKSIFCFLRNT